MDWFKLAADFYRDPALRAADREVRGARDLFLNGLGYCTEQHTSGHLPEHALSALDVTAPQKKVSALVRHGLLLPSDGGWDYRSWDRHQGGMDALIRRQAADRERQRLARLRKKEGQSEDGSRDASRDSQQDAPRDVGRDLDRDLDQEKDTASPRKRGPNKTSAPDLFPITPSMRTWGEKNATLVDNPKRETDQFLDYHRAKGSRFVDWTQAWQTWMRNAQKFAEQRAPKIDPDANPHHEWMGSNR